MSNPAPRVVAAWLWLWRKAFWDAHALHLAISGLAVVLAITCVLALCVRCRQRSILASIHRQSARRPRRAHAAGSTGTTAAAASAAPGLRRRNTRPDSGVDSGVDSDEGRDHASTPPPTPRKRTVAERGQSPAARRCRQTRHCVPLLLGSILLSALGWAAYDNHLLPGAVHDVVVRGKLAASQAAGAWSDTNTPSVPHLDPIIAWHPHDLMHQECPAVSHFTCVNTVIPQLPYYVAIHNDSVWVAHMGPVHLLPTHTFRMVERPASEQGPRTLVILGATIHSSLFVWPLFQALNRFTDLDPFPSTTREGVLRSHRHHGAAPALALGIRAEDHHLADVLSMDSFDCHDHDVFFLHPHRNTIVQVSAAGQPDHPSQATPDTGTAMHQCTSSVTQTAFQCTVSRSVPSRFLDDALGCDMGTDEQT